MLNSLITAPLSGQVNDAKPALIPAISAARPETANLGHNSGDAGETFESVLTEKQRIIAIPDNAIPDKEVADNGENAKGTDSQISDPEDAALNILPQIDETPEVLLTSDAKGKTPVLPDVDEPIFGLDEGTPIDLPHVKDTRIPATTDIAAAPRRDRAQPVNPENVGIERAIVTVPTTTSTDTAQAQLTSRANVALGLKSDNAPLLSDQTANAAPDEPKRASAFTPQRPHTLIPSAMVGQNDKAGIAALPVKAAATRPVEIDRLPQTDRIQAAPRPATSIDGLAPPQSPDFHALQPNTQTLFGRPDLANADQATLKSARTNHRDALLDKISGGKTSGARPITQPGLVIPTGFANLPEPMTKPLTNTGKVNWISETGILSDLGTTSETGTMVKTPLDQILRQPGLPRHLAAQIANVVGRSGPDKPVELLLNPAELGRVRIKMVSVDGTMSVQVIADRVETLDLMRRHIDVLAREFLDIGYGGTEFSFGQNTPENDQKHENEPHTVASGTENSDPADEPAIPAETITQLRVMPDRVDIRL